MHEIARGRGIVDPDAAIWRRSELTNLPRQSDRVTIGKQLEKLIELQILDDDSTSSSESDLEMLDLLSTDTDSTDSSSDSDRDEDILDDSDTDYEDDIADLDALREVLQHSRYFTRADKWEKSSEFFVFHNNSPKPQAAVFVQLAVALDHFGHEGNGACLDRSMLLWGISHGSMVNYTNRVMIALESCMGQEIAWPNR
ncbi:hypothetical protein R1sor_010340 [Riccia sorocarpa]|uniref:PDEase domain-containing protein n=1 Tax=Riccia sorocarpa TaxID=122646 RepID=A0ABD3HZM7_9MARC